MGILPWEDNRRSTKSGGDPAGYSRFVIVYIIILAT